MTAVSAAEAASLGEWAAAEERFGVVTVDVPADRWIEALTAVRDGLGCAFFDWLSAVDLLEDGFEVYVHAARVGEPGRAERLLVRTRLPRDAAELPSAVGVWAGAAWHERETHEMFGIGFTGHPGLAPLLLPDGFEGHPLRKEFVLAARVAKAWPGAKEPGGETPRRRAMLPPGVPDPNEWGPDAGKLPPAPPARRARPAAAPSEAGPDAPAAPRRARTASGQPPQSGAE
ncbi:NADH-quinone oxidoreductase subunit C, partial [Mangrovactinospora gilvigrisea]|uniref:NADH-quinone oxidoreductase subunit C n=1 Tax=Mangrovactinospora gilvigrisea TaxID=1428644 RepID=UPI000ADAE898